MLKEEKWCERQGRAAASEAQKAGPLWSFVPGPSFPTMFSHLLPVMLEIPLAGDEVSFATLNITAD